MNRYYVCRYQEQIPQGFEVLLAGDNLYTGENDFRVAFGEPSSMESDLLLIASSIFAVDRATLRGERENISRSFHLSIPVVNIGRLLPTLGLIEEVLHRLTNDTWIIELRQIPGELINGTEPTLSTNGKVLLFSGGLDSLAAAIEFGENTQNIHLVSHHTRNSVTSSTQRSLVAMVENAGYRFRHYPFFISSRTGGPTNLDHDEENSQRSRSFMFLTIGALTAVRNGNTEVYYLAENGQLAIHLPLSTGRIGAFSTHTAHPEVLMSMERFLNQALNTNLQIINPYVYMTKREVIRCVIEKLPESIPISNSCWKNSRLSGSFTHCGICVPCYVRRIAIESYTTDNTAYARDPWRENIISMAPDDDGRRNLFDLTEFIKYFERESNEELMNEWPELYSDSLNADETIRMYRRFAIEAKSVLTRYPNLSPWLQ